MDQISRAANGLLALIVSLFDVILAGIGVIELWIRAQLTALRVPAPIGTAILIVLAVILIVTAIRLFGGVFRLLILTFLVLLMIQVLVSVAQA